MRPMLTPLLLTAALLMGCQPSTTKTPPSVKITNLEAGQVLTGTVTVKVNASEQPDIERVTLYARPAGTAGKGVAVGSSGAAPFDIAWFTARYPNASTAEVYAEATTAAGGRGTSPTVTVQLRQITAPLLRYVVTLSYPAVATTGSQMLTPARRPEIDPMNTRLATGEPHTPVATAAVKPQAEGAQITDLEWGWNAVEGADGYGIYLSMETPLGQYQRVRNQAATRQTVQGTVHNVNGTPGQRYHGAVTEIRQQTEGPMSNALSAPVLQAQQLVSPANGAVVGDGRPTLTWLGNADADGYQYFLYSQDPDKVRSVPVWTNDFAATRNLAALYPGDRPALAPGRYYWRVAGIRFQDNVPVGYSFSPVFTFTVQ
jgi:Bacterial Ig domain